MSKLTKEFKDDVNTSMKQGNYVARRILLSVLAFVVVIAVFGTAMRFFNVNVDRMIFKNSVTYTEGTAQFLSKSFQEYHATDDRAEKRAIMEYVMMRYPNISLSSIENEKLKQFYVLCTNGGN